MRIGTFLRQMSFSALLAPIALYGCGSKSQLGGSSKVSRSKNASEPHDPKTSAPDAPAQAARPLIDLTFTLGQSSDDKVAKLSGSLEGLKASLEVKGYDVKITAIKMDTITAQSNFDWQVFDHPNFFEPLGPTLPQHILTEGDSFKMMGYTKAPNRDFLFAKSTSRLQKTFSFNIDRDNSNWHTMYGGGFLFNTSIRGDKILGYALMVTEDGLKLHKINESLSDFRDGITVGSGRPTPPVDTDHSPHRDSFGTILGTWPIGNVTDPHQLKIIVDPTHLSVWDFDKPLVTDYLLPESLPETGFGPLTAHARHACSQVSYFTFGKIQMITLDWKTLAAFLLNPDFRQDAKKFVINLSDNVVAGLESDVEIAAAADKLKTLSAHMVGLGSPENKQQFDQLIQKNGNAGVFLLNQDMDKALEEMKNFIHSKL